MSLVILSNNQQEYLISDGVDGIQNPNSFHNAMSNTITLPPHTEVGVVSAKIHRSPEVVIQRNSVFMIYFGKMLDQTLGEILIEESTNIPIPVVMPAGTYTRTRLETVLQTAISDAFSCHPNLAHNGVVVSKPASAGLPAAAIGGWSFKIIQTSIATPISSTDATLVVNNISDGVNQLNLQYLGASIRNNVPSLGYTPATKRITRLTAGSSAVAPWDFGGIAQIKDLPLTMTDGLTTLNGAMSVDFTHALDAGALFLPNEGWEISLTRPEVRSSQAGGGASSGGGGVLGGGHRNSDYMVRYDGGTGLLSLLHTKTPAGGPNINQMEMVPVTYFGGDIVALDATAWAAQVTTADLIYDPLAAGQLNRLNWRFEGEKVYVWLSEDDYSGGRSLMNTTVDGWAQLGLSRAFKPTGTTTQTLYPKFNLSTQNAYFILDIYQCPLPFSKRHGEAGGYNFPDNVPLAGGIGNPSGGSSFWGKAIYDDLYMNQAALERQQFRLTGAGAQPAYVGMDASTLAAGALVNNEAIAYGYGFILNDAGEEAGEYTNQGSTENCREWLGYPVDVMPGNVLSYDGLDHTGQLTDASGTQPDVGHCQWLVNSSAGMDFTPKQLFIKCPSLTHQSFNFCKGLTSKILWSLPRFSNSGETTGPLFFQQSHPIYLSLRNNAPLVINDLQIDFVDKNEQIVEDLGGETVVVLHFKTSHHC